MRTLLLASLIILENFSWAQSSTLAKNTQHALYYKVFGPGLFFGSVNYDFTYHMSEKQGVRARAGLAVYDGLFAIGSINYSVGANKRYGEIGFGGTTFHTLTGEEKPDFFIRPGYRFKGNKGLLITAALYIQSINGSFVENSLYIPGIGVGFVLK